MNKKLILRLFCVLFFSNQFCLTLFGQTETEPVVINNDTLTAQAKKDSLINGYGQYHIWMTNTNSSYKHRIQLLDVGEDHIEIYQFNGLRKVKLEELGSISYRENGAIGQGIFRGVIFGALIGGAIGYLSGDDEPSLFFNFTKEDKAFMFGFSGAAVGAVLGGVIGAARIRIPIEGQSELFKQEKEQLKLLTN